MRNDTKAERYTTKVIDSGTVVFDETGRWVQNFATEAEADEFIVECAISNKLEETE